MSGYCLKRAGEVAEAVGPDGFCGFVEVERGAGGEELPGGGLDGEVSRGVFLPGADLLVGLDLEVAVEGAGVAAVGGVPEGPGEGFAVVGEGEGDGGEGGVAVVAVGVVFGGGADPDLDVGHAAAALVRGGEGAEAGGHGDGGRVRDGVADEVGARRLGGLGRSRGLGGAAEGGHGAGEFGLHGVDQDGVGGFGSGGLVAGLEDCGKESGGCSGEGDAEEGEMSCQVDPLCEVMQDANELSVSDRARPSGETDGGAEGTAVSWTA